MRSDCLDQRLSEKRVVCGDKDDMKSHRGDAGGKDIRIRTLAELLEHVLRNKSACARDRIVGLKPRAVVVWIACNIEEITL